MKQGQLEFIDTAIKCNNIAHKRMFGTDSDGTGYDQTDAIVEETKKELVANGITGCYDKEILDYLKSEYAEQDECWRWHLIRGCHRHLLLYLTDMEFVWSGIMQDARLADIV